MKGTSRQFGLLLLLTAVAVLGLVGFLDYHNFRAFEQNLALMHSARQVLTTNTSLLSHTRDAESGQRGYLLTGRADYLAPYTAAAQIIPSEIRQLEKLTA